jgi:hypothetical protein
MYVPRQESLRRNRVPSTSYVCGRQVRRGLFFGRMGLNMTLKHPLFFAGGLDGLSKTQTWDIEDTGHEVIAVHHCDCV